MIRHLRVCVATALFGAASHAVADLEKDVSIEKDIPTGPTGEYVELFPNFRFYPGQKLTLNIAGQIDVNHRYWEDRQCNWFGVNCWYENRDAAQMHATDAFPVLVRATVGGIDSPLRSPKQAVDPELSLTHEPHIPVPAADRKSPQTVSADIQFDGASVDPMKFGTQITLWAKIADRTAGGLVMNRSSCVGRSTCSGGAYKVRLVHVDNSARLAALKALLSSAKPPPSRVLPNLDRVFLRDVMVKDAIALALFDYASARFSTPEEQGSPELIEYLDFAATQITPSHIKSGSISNALTAAYLKSGNMAKAKLEAEKNHGKLTEDFQKDPGNVNVRMAYVDNLCQLGAIKVRERSGLYTADLIKAVALYRRASAIAEEAGSDQTVPSGDRKQLLTKSYESLVEAMRVLMMARTADNLERAEVLSEQAIVIARKAAAIN